MGRHNIPPQKKKRGGSHSRTESSSWKTWSKQAFALIGVAVFTAFVVICARWLWGVWNTPEVLQDPQADVAEFSLGQTAVSETGVSILVASATPDDDQVCAEVSVTNNTSEVFSASTTNFLLATPAPDTRFILPTGGTFAEGEVAAGQSQSGSVCWNGVDVTASSGWAVHYVHDPLAPRTDGKWAIA